MDINKASIRECINKLIEDFDKMDFIERDRVREVILECYEMTKKSPRELLVTGLYSTEEIDYLYPEKLAQDYYIFFQCELERICGWIIKYMNGCIYTQELQDGGISDFYDIFNDTISNCKLLTLAKLKHQTDIALYHYMEGCKSDKDLWIQLLGIRYSLQSKPKLRFECMQAEAHVFYNNFTKYKKFYFTQEPAGISEMFNTPALRDHDYSKKPTHGCALLLDLVKMEIGTHTQRYFKHIEDLKVMMQINFNVYIGKRLLIAGDL